MIEKKRSIKELSVIEEVERKKHRRKKRSGKEEKKSERDIINKYPFPVFIISSIAEFEHIPISQYECNDFIRHFNLPPIEMLSNIIANITG